MKLFFALLILFVSANVYSEPELTADAFEGDILYFFEEYCMDCHGDVRQRGDRRFDTLAYPIVDDNMLVDFQDALDQLNLGEMPPKDKNQPAEAEKLEVIDWLTAAIDKKQKERTNTGGETVIRRLNRREYLNTVGDLFDINTTSFDPTEKFPADQEEHHLDNQGHVLVTSGFLLDQYLDAAERVMNIALPPLQKPKKETWSFQGGFKLQPELHGRIASFEVKESIGKNIKNIEYLLKRIGSSSDPVQIEGWREKANQSLGLAFKSAEMISQEIRLYEHPRSQRHVGSYGYVSKLAEGVPADGYYLVAVYAEAMHLDSPDVAESNINSDEPMILGIVPGSQSYGDLHLPQPIEPVLARFELTQPGAAKYQATRVWLYKGQTPRFIWINGSDRARSAHIKVGQRILKERGLTVEKPDDAFTFGLEHAELPHIRIKQVYLQGPHFDTWPMHGQKLLLGGRRFDQKKNRQNIENFLKLAYRRPPLESEIDSILSIVESRQKQGVAPYDAYRDGLKAALCSPGFIYLEEPSKKGDPETLDSFAIASRLSYYLWSSMPDRELTNLAERDLLKDRQVREDQVERMLKDPKSDRFVKDFLNSWLALASLGETPPDRSSFKQYYNDGLQEAMKEETFLFTRHILDKNLSSDNFIDSDFIFVNQALAKLYGQTSIPLKTGFQKIRPTSGARGGLLGQSSVLTATANGVDTSPIVRGVWLLENLLGTPTAPPPPDIEPLDPDIRGAKTIRDQLEKHRTNASCNECHRKIDPLGFALENFDAIGRVRSRYRGGGGKIDPSGELPNGTPFANMAQFKKALLKENHKVHRALVEKLMAYALGRHLDISDRPELDKVVKGMEENNNSFRYAVKQVAMSEMFVQP